MFIKVGTNIDYKQAIGMYIFYQLLKFTAPILNIP